MNKLRRTKVSIDNDPIVEAYVIEERWNGWAIPFFDKENALKLVAADHFPLVYDEETDTFREVDVDDPLEWQGGFNTEVGEVLYAIGAGYYTWSEV